MSVFTLVFYILALITLLSAWVVATSRNIVHSGFALIFAFLGVAGLYIQLSMDYLAAMQVLVYAGGITVLILFAVMLTRGIEEPEKSSPVMNRPASALAATGVLALVLFLIFNSDWNLRAPQVLAPGEGISALLGYELLGKYLLPFEIASVLLLAALIGAVMIARREIRDEEEAS
ncbi:MAG: NADH-quinone oxidoreductase subunit J [Candidatus Krumholzibacteria bacterium]|nr:NADH-quinone oxidoreductase subunit J [Candidatus Krumholzibacteria bacterium]MDP6668504.1 NADH-quinone oxidoreductase subunit J [Candidatus Krumholzibacteria bacterium]MDP7021385.1 NADH-quinone oxidoreductase subunit J [Candidatus Krumholzibacteria bacterium]